LTIYTNGYYINDGAIGNNEETIHEDSFIDIEDIIKDSWVIENYPKAVKSQTDYWSKYNNWDDGETILIAADIEQINSSKA
jgi:hypothetical protein